MAPLFEKKGCFFDMQNGILMFFNGIYEAKK
jgi:hypothetical protein